QSPSLDLSGTDCSDGLLRCEEGEVEASLAAHLPRCESKGAQERNGCSGCPWQAIYRCTTGWGQEGLEVVGFADAGAGQLCRPLAPVARPSLIPSPAGSLDAEQGRVEICASEGYACVDETVRLCERTGQPVRFVGRCLYGCHPGISIDP